MIRAKSIPAKEAGKTLRKRLNHANPNVQILTLKVSTKDYFYTKHIF
jgi:hypothetical protein